MKVSMSLYVKSGVMPTMRLLQGFALSNDGEHVIAKSAVSRHDGEHVIARSAVSRHDEAISM